MTKAFSYTRFSTPEQAAGDSFRRQTAAAAEYAAKHGLELDTSLTFQDLGVSAFRGQNVEAGRLGEFGQAVRDGLVPVGSVLLVESLDRISRQSARKALRVLEDIVELGVTVVTLTDGKTYTRESLDSDPMSLLMSLMVFIRANEESATKARRLKAAWVGKRSRAAAGCKPLTAIAPAWLRLNRDEGRFEVVPERAEIVQRIFREAVAGRGQHMIAEGLNRDGVPVFGGAAMWWKSYVKKVLGNSAVVGTFTPHTVEHVDGKKVRVPSGEPVVGYFPAVVDEDDFRRVQAVGAGPMRGRHTVIRNVLGSMAVCPLCGGTLIDVDKRMGQGIGSAAHQPRSQPP